VPGGKYTMAGVVVDESQPCPQRDPAVIAALIAAVSSVDPSPAAPKSLTFRKIWYPVVPKGTVPCLVIDESQYELVEAVLPA
jgi:hypothetical protein